MQVKREHQLRLQMTRRARWLGIALCFMLACSREPTSPQPRRYDLTFDDAQAIYETSVDSVHVRLVMQDTLTTYDLSWAPDGREVAFTRQYYQAGQYFYRVVIFNAVDGTQKVLTHGPDDSFQPAWSPDGTRIAYLTRPLGGFDATLRTVRVDGTGDQQLGSGQYFVRPPRWSPDARQLAATRIDLTVVVVDAASGSLVREIAPGMSPTWSPDGLRLAFVSDGGDTVKFANADGSDLRALPFRAFQPAWSPDGDWIAVETGIPGIYLIPPGAIDTTGFRRIAPGAGPAWRLRQ